MAGGYEITGIREAIRGINRTITTINDSTKTAIMECALDLKGKSQEKAPIKDGHLRGSATVTAIRNGAEIGFNEIYALKQHEELGYRHPQGGEAKYLERPLQQNTTRYVNLIKNAINNSTR